MTARHDVIVVGLGAMGSACCYHLAQRGVRVLGLEQFDIPHSLGSSGGQSRLIRLAYYEHPDYVPLLRRAYRNWDELGERLGREVLHRTGCLYLGRPDDHLVSGTLRAAADHDLHIEEVDRARLAEQFSTFAVPEDFAALFEPEGGFVLSERAIEGHVELALRAGAQVRAREGVREWKVEGDGVAVTTERGRYSADRIVFCAGAWSDRLVRDLGVELSVTRQPLGWVWPSEPDRYEIGRFPCWAIQDDAPDFEGIYYGFPLLPASRFAGERGLKLAHHFVGTPCDPDNVDREPRLADEEDFRPALRRFLPGADGPTLVRRVCMYTVTPDEHFIVDRHPEHERVTVACGFSGHGFKFASAIGEALADFTVDGRSELPVGFLGLGRFSGGPALPAGPLQAKRRGA